MSGQITLSESLLLVNVVVIQRADDGLTSTAFTCWHCKLCNVNDMN